MVFCLESSNRRILSLMQKGIETDTAKNVIEYCLDSGVAILESRRINLDSLHDEEENELYMVIS